MANYYFCSLVFCITVVTAANTATLHEGPRSPRVSLHDTRSPRVFAVARTLVRSVASTTTTTVPSTCYTAITTTACTGRKKRALPQKIGTLGTSDMGLEGSVLAGAETASETPLTDQRLRRLERNGRVILWRSRTTTVLITATSTDTATSVIISFGCSFSALSTVSACG